LKRELLELKSRVKSLEDLRKKLLKLKAIHIVTLRQVDTYFNSPKGKFKIRQVDNQEKAKLIFYCREFVYGPKRNEAILIDITEPESFKEFFQKSLGILIIVDKEREIYTFKKTQIHLDKVQNLGKFIEFERIITNLKKDKRTLEILMKNLQIQQKDLIQGSYCDLMMEQNQ